MQQAQQDLMKRTTVGTLNICRKTQISEGEKTCVCLCSHVPVRSSGCGCRCYGGAAHCRTFNPAVIHARVAEHAAPQSEVQGSIMMGHGTNSCAAGRGSHTSSTSRSRSNSQRPGTNKKPLLQEKNYTPNCTHTSEQLV